MSESGREASFCLRGNGIDRAITVGQNQKQVVRKGESANSGEAECINSPSDLLSTVLTSSPLRCSGIVARLRAFDLYHHEKG